MIAYVKYTSKRVLLRKSNIFLIVFAIGIVCVFFIMNIRIQDEFKTKLEKQISKEMDDIKTYEEKLAGIEKNGNEYLFYRNTIEVARSRIQEDKEVLAHYNNKDWNRMYATYTKTLKERKGVVENSQARDGATDDSAHIRYIDQELTYITYLKENTLAYENLDYPIFGLSFTSSMAQMIFPMMIMICCIYLLAQVFTMDYAKAIDTSRLLPIGKQKVMFIKMGMSIGISISVFLLILLSSFLLASLVTLNTGLDYPFIMQGNQAEIWVAVKLTTLMKDWVLMGILFYVNVGFFIYILSSLIKDDGMLFLTGLCIMIGVAYIPTVVGFMGKVAHLLPTTYMNFANVVNGNVAAQYSNVNVSTFTGIQVLLISMLGQFAFCILRNYTRKQSVS